MPRPFMFAFVMAGAALSGGAPAPALFAAETDSPPARRSRVLFTPEEIARVRAEVAAAEERREVYRRQYAGEPIIVLAPFIVEGDSSLLLASVRRQLETTPESIRLRVAEVAPLLAHRAAYSARVNDEFFGLTRAPSPGAPRDALLTGGVDFLSLTRNPPKSIADIFRSPE